VKIAVGDTVRTPEGLEGLVVLIRRQEVPHGAHWRLDESDPSYAPLKTYAVVEVRPQVQATYSDDVLVLVEQGTNASRARARETRGGG